MSVSGTIPRILPSHMEQQAPMVEADTDLPHPGQVSFGILPSRSM